MDLLARLQAWYRSNCDGDWEHTYGIQIENLDNPGWHLSVDIEEIDADEMTFVPVEVHHSAEDWYQCFLRDGKFKGYGGAQNLTDLLRTFLEWADRADVGKDSAPI